MSHRLSKSQKRDQVARLFEEQTGACYYCLRETFLPVRGVFLATAAAVRLMATREHLIKRQDGGTDQDFNIVMACFECNSTRGDRSVLDHVKFCRQHHGTIAQSELAA